MIEAVDNWRQAWRMFSVQLMAAAGALQVAWVSLPPDTQEAILKHLHPDAVHWITAAMALLGIVGRLVRQPKVHA